MIKKKIAVLTSGWSVDFILQVLEGMKRVCLQENVELHVFTCYKSYESNGEENKTGFAIFDLANLKKYDGIVLMSNLFNDKERADFEYKRILEAGIPAVSINQQLDGFHYIGSNNVDVYKELVSHLIEVHKVSDFAYIGGPVENVGAQANLQAFLSSLKEHKLAISNDSLYLGGDWSFDYAYKIAQQIFAKGKKIPQAVACINDWAAIAVTKAALEHNINVPEDLLVIGFDDIFCAKSVIPSISTVNIQSELMGEEAIRLLLKKTKKIETINIKALPFYRQSCGCEKNVSPEQKLSSLDSPQKIDSSQRFASHLRHIENAFINSGSIEALEDALQSFFAARHPFEGNNFSILVKEEVIKSLENVSFSYQDSPSYGKKMRTLVNIKDNKAVKSEEKDNIIFTRDLYPSSMKDSKGALYLFIPIYNQNSVHGYYVSKNSLDILYDKIAYNWTRNLGTNIEKFRQTINYKLMSQQLQKISTQDALTGLLNRTGFNIFATEMFYKNNNNHKKSFIMFVDINSMKVINDKHGHLHGDLAVKTVAETIKNVFPKSFLSIRYGGDEFVIIGTKAENNKTDYHAKLQEDLEQRIKNMSLPYNLSVSMGSKIFLPNERETLREAIEDVDEIMYVNKTAFHKELDEKNHKKT